MLWPRLSPERSCVCCRSRRRLDRLRARAASHCNLDRVVFRYQNERRSRLLAASSYCATGIDLFGILPLRSFPGAGTDQDGRNRLSAVGRYGHGRTSRLPRRTLWVRFRFQLGVKGRGPPGLQYVDSAIDAALLAEEWDAADAYADALAERTAAEKLLHHLCPRVKRPDAHPLRCLRRAVAVVHHRNARPASDGGNLRASGGA
jgi:hypothetical protein